jgi:hypothetical protein
MLSGGVWQVQTTKKARAVIYFNMLTGQRIPCGENRLDTPIDMILDWIADVANAGDTAMVDGKSVLFKMREGSA